MLHGGFGRASQAEKSYHWNAEADAGHFLVAYPDGLNRAWNAGGGCCGTPGRTGADDIGFIAAMVSAIEHAVPVDAGRVYATGISNGGIMAYDLACHTTIFAAIGPDSATELGGCPDPATLSVIAVHGTADKNIPYAGGEGDGPARIDGPSVPAVNASWRRTDGCSPPAMTTAGTVTTSVADCPAGRAVELITIAGPATSGQAPRPACWRSGYCTPTRHRRHSMRLPSSGGSSRRTLADDPRLVLKGAGRRARTPGRGRRRPTGVPSTAAPARRTR